MRWRACFTCHGPPGPDEAPRDGLATSCMSAEMKLVDANVLIYLFEGESSRMAGTGLAEDVCEGSRWLLIHYSP